MTLSAEEFGEAWLAFLRQAVSGLPAVDPPLLVRVREHLGTEPGALPVIAEHLPVWEHVNLQRGMDAWLAQQGRGAELCGLAGEQKPGG